MSIRLHKSMVFFKKAKGLFIFISTIGVVADVSTPIAPVLHYALYFSVVLLVCVLISLLFTTKSTNGSKSLIIIPSVASGVLGLMLFCQTQFAIEGRGLLASFVPGVANLQALVFDNQQRIANLEKNSLQTLLRTSIANNDELELGRLLEGNPRPIGVKDADGDTLLHFALQVKGISPEIIRLLLRNDPSVDQLTSSGESCLRVCVANQDNIEILSLLIGAGANPKSNDSSWSHLLLFAIAQGSNLNTIELIVSSGADVHTMFRGATALDLSLFEGNEQAAEYLLKAGAQPDMSEGLSSVIIAQEGGISGKMIKQLIDAGASYKGMSLAGVNNLHDALEAGVEPNVFESLIVVGADIEQLNAAMETPIMVAIYSVKLEEIAHLIEAGANLNAINPVTSKSVLEYAIDTDSIEICDAIVEAGANVNAKDNTGTSVLTKCVERNNLPAAIFLLSKGAYPVGSALFAAIDQDNAEVLTALVLAGADCTAEKEGFSALFHAAMSSTPECVFLLIRGGANPNDEDLQVGTALSIAILSDNLRVIPTLLDEGVDVNNKIGKGFSLLSYAITNGSPQSVSLLIDSGADVNARDDLENSTPLMAAVHAVNTEALVTLLDNGAEIDSQNNLGWTALILSSISGWGDGISMLLEAGADSSLKSKSGKSALDYALSSIPEESWDTVFADYPLVRLSWEKAIRKLQHID